MKQYEQIFKDLILEAPELMGTELKPMIEISGHFLLEAKEKIAHIQFRYQTRKPTQSQSGSALIGNISFTDGITTFGNIPIYLNGNSISIQSLSTLRSLTSSVDEFTVKEVVSLPEGKHLLSPRSFGEAVREVEITKANSIDNIVIDYLPVARVNLAKPVLMFPTGMTIEYDSLNETMTKVPTSLANRIAGYVARQVYNQTEEVQIESLHELYGVATAINAQPEQLELTFA